MSLPRISVIMPVFNGEHYLQEAIDSILTQTFPDLEFIIINDGSIDHTKDILDSYHDSRIRVYNQVNCGIEISLNRGIAAARGEFIARQDADDISLPTRFEKQLNFLIKHPEVGLVGSWYEVISTNGTSISRIETLPTSSNGIFIELIDHNCFCHGSIMCRKETLLKSGLYRHGSYPAEDYDLWLRISEITELANIPEILYQYRLNENSISNTTMEIQIELDQLVRSLASIRRSGKQEPDNIFSLLSAVEPERFINRCTGKTKLYYLAGSEASSKIYISYMLPLLKERSRLLNVIEELTEFANQLDGTADEELGLAYIRLVSAVFRTQSFKNFYISVYIQGVYWGKRLFLLDRIKDYRRMRKSFLRALIYNPFWIMNKGFLRLGVDSILALYSKRYTSINS